MGRTLLERTVALEAIEAALDARVVVVHGPAGRGKSAVLEAVADRHPDALVLCAFGEEGARLWPFGVLVEVLKPLVVADGDLLFMGAAAGARPLFESNPAVDAAPPRELAATRMHALVAMLEGIGARPGGALVCVDDVHWADEQSLTLLVRLAERGLARGVRVVTAARSGRSGKNPLLERLLAASKVVELAPLSARAVGDLLRAGGTQIAQAEHERAHALTGGNPFLVEQLGVALAEGTTDLAGGDLLVRGAAARQIVARVAGAGPATLALSQAAAALGREATVTRAARVAGLQADAATAAAAALGHLDMLASDEGITMHALVADALLDELGSAARQRLRRLGAHVLDADGAPAARVAALLMDAEPAADERAVAVLERAAAGARSAGAASEAVRLLERALLEPPAGACRLRVRLALAETRASLGAEEADGDFEAAMDLTRSDEERIEVLVAHARAQTQQGRFPEADATVARAEAMVDAATPAKLVGALRATAVLARNFTTPSDALSLNSEDPGTALQSLLGAALTGAIDAEQALASLLPLIADGRLAAEADPALLSMVTGVLYFTGELARSIEFSTAALAAPGRTEQEAAVIRYLRSVPHLLTGDVAAATADARACIDGLGPDSGWTYGGYYVLAAIELEVAGPEEALRVFDRAPGDEGPAAGAVSQIWLANRARALLAAGRPAEALADALESCRNVVGTVCRGVAFNDWHAPAALAHLALGDRAAAATVAREAVESATFWGAPSDMVEPLYVLGLVEGDLALFDRSVEAAMASEDLRGRTAALVQRGAALRRAGHDRRAREDLYAARDLAFKHGFRRLGQKASEELVTAGARPRNGARSGAGALTASEARVVRLAAAGATNRQIASELFLSTKTVEFHLSRAYRKLGVSRRSELRAALVGPRE